MILLATSELNTFGLRVWSGSVNEKYPPHRHNEIELNAIESGYFTYIFAGRQVTVSAGEIGLFWGAIPHQVIDFAPNTQLHWGTIPLDDMLGWELPRPFVTAVLSGAFLQMPDDLYDRRFFAQWAADLAAGQASIALLELKAMFSRFAQALDSMPRTPEPVAEGRAAHMALMMSRRYQEPLTVGEIAAVVSLQPNYAMSIFKAAFGMSLIEYLLWQRVAHAQQLLIMTDASVAEVALDSGFQTLSHFYSTFTRLCGVAPGRYRAALRR